MTGKQFRLSGHEEKEQQLQRDKHL